MGQEEINAVAEVLKSGWIGLGPKVEEFEKNFANYIGVKHAIAVSSCTEALHLALKVLGIKSGEVIVPAITFVSTALAANYNNAKPVFADVNEDTLTINVDDVKRKITPKTKAIIPMHYGGHPAEMDEINEIATEHNLKVIEDAAHACGASYKDKKAGILADIGCFSFHAVKNLATGDGGMITTNDDEVDKRLRKLRWVGINKDTFMRAKAAYSWYYEIEELGLKAHMNDITAAIGLVQLKRLEKMNARRREIFNFYNKEFQNLSWLKIPIEKDYVKSAFHNYAVKVDDQEKFIEHLQNNGIATTVHYMPLHLHPIYENLRAETSVPVAEKIWKKIVLLPMFPDLTNEELRKIADAVKNFK